MSVLLQLITGNSGVLAFALCFGLSFAFALSITVFAGAFGCFLAVAAVVRFLAIGYIPATALKVDGWPSDPAHDFAAPALHTFRHTAV